MREIKFRAWDKDWGRMASLSEVTLIAWPELRACVYDKSGKQVILPLMQFTGLKDKNGVDIYEGDVIRYGESVADYHSITVEIVISLDGESLTTIEWNPECEVIGNIHQHPELLK